MLGRTFCFCFCRRVWFVLLFGSVQSRLHSPCWSNFLSFFSSLAPPLRKFHYFSWTFPATRNQIKTEEKDRTGNSTRADRGAMNNLPESVLAHMLTYVELRDLIRCEATCRLQRKYLLSSSAEDLVWREVVATTWSPGLSYGKHGGWRAAAGFLEQEVWPLIRQKGVKPALANLAGVAMLSLPKNARQRWAFRESLDIVRSCLRFRANDLDAKRRVALFVCSADFAGAPTIKYDDDTSWCCDSSETRQGEDSDDSLPDLSSSSDPSDGQVDDEEERTTYSNLRRVLSLFASSSLGKHALDPEDALRKLLLEFPFLPIDAGEGADRAIKAVARMYLDSHPEQFQQLRNKASQHIVRSYGNATRSAHDDPASAIYILLYAVIMLNTDLHNPKIKPKMTCDEFVRCTQNTVLRDTFSAAELQRIYHSIKRQALSICSSKLSTPELKLQNLHLPPSAVTSATSSESAHRGAAHSVPSGAAPSSSPTSLGTLFFIISSVMVAITAILFPSWRRLPTALPFRMMFGAESYIASRN